MKKCMLLYSLFFLTSPMVADVSVKGYSKQDGTQVDQHIRSSPNRSTLDNWSTSGNQNPWTGKKGTKRS